MILLLAAVLWLITAAAEVITWPPPVMHARKGDTVLINVVSSIAQSVTFHFHGPAVVTHCPIPPGSAHVQPTT